MILFHPILIKSSVRDFIVCVILIGPVKAKNSFIFLKKKLLKAHVVVWCDIHAKERQCAMKLGILFRSSIGLNCSGIAAPISDRSGTVHRN